MPCPNEPAGELTAVEAAPMTLLPPAPGKCPLCAVAHPDWQAHNAQSLFYGARFMQAHGRSPRWSDAVAHCAPAVQQQWRVGLSAHGVWTKEDDEALANGTAIAEPPPPG